MVARALGPVLSGQRIALPLLFAVPACLASHDALALHAAFSWQGIAACERVSPGFSVTDVPPGTKRLYFILRDAQAPHFRHGGSSVTYSGAKIPQGAIRYIGPCPPPGETHHYAWTIEAMDGQGHVLAKTNAAADFPMK